MQIRCGPYYIFLFCFLVTADSILCGYSTKRTSNHNKNIKKLCVRVCDEWMCLCCLCECSSWVVHYDIQAIDNGKMTNVAIFKTSLNPDRSIQEDAQNVKQFTIIKFRFFSVFSFSSICPICLFLFNVRRFHVYCIFFVCHTRLAHTLKFIYENMFTSIFYILLPSRIICDASISHII